MALYLVVQGPTAEPHDPKLTDEGAAAVQRIAGVARDYGVKPLRILHSGKEPAKQTAKLIAMTLDPRDGVATRNGIDATDDPAPVIGYFDTAEQLMVVGAQAFLDHALSLLVTGSRKRRVMQMQPGGIVCLDLDAETKQWVIKWTLMPTID